MLDAISETSDEESICTIVSEDTEPWPVQIYFTATTCNKLGNDETCQIKFVCEANEWREYRRWTDDQIVRLVHHYPVSNTVESLKDWLHIDFNRVQQNRVIMSDEL